jgi:hypothetical protein
MVSTKSLVSTAFAGLALAAVSGAQQVTDFRAVEGPLTRVHYDIATGEVTRLGNDGGGVHNTDPIGVGTQKALANCFSNTVTTGYYTGLTNGWEFIDYATKDCGTSGLIGMFGFAYATTARDLTDAPPGPGAAIAVNIYQGGSAFCGSAGTLAGSFGFTGLPGAIGTQVSPGFAVTATLAPNAPMALADGPISWGYAGIDGPQGSGAASGPFLTDFNSNTGWADVFDAYNRTPNSAGTCVVSFFFGGCSPPVPPPTTGTPCSGFWLQLWEQGSKTSSATSRTCGTNANIFAHLGSDANGDLIPDAGPAGPVINETWQSAVGAGISLVAITKTPLPGIPLGGIFGGTFICGSGTLFTQTAFGAHNIPIPADLSLSGASLVTQGAAISIGPVSIALANAIDIVIGVR